MAEPIPEDPNWHYEYIDHYRLDEEIINGFLCRKWGEQYKYFVKARGLPTSKPTTIG